MNSTEFHKLLKGKFPFELTIKQDVVLQRLANFVLDTKEDNLFILKGYAGTGKTTLIGTLVNSLWNAHKSSVLLAPTGRAAKVISKYAKREALTIHKKIYFPKKESGGGVSFVLQPNKNKISWLLDQGIEYIVGNSEEFIESVYKQEMRENFEKVEDGVGIANYE